MDYLYKTILKIYVKTINLERVELLQITQLVTALTLLTLSISVLFMIIN